VIRIGSAADNDLVLADSKVSRHHAEVRLEGEGARLKDLDSTNGTFVDKLRIHEVDLEPGMSCRLGDSLLRFEERLESRDPVVGEEQGLAGMVGASPPMREVYAMLRAVADTPAGVLVTGETGTGKELVARALHELSDRPGKLVVYDAASADPQMMRADLFGHVKGAFTGAQEARDGAFRTAHRGTLFIDEVGELPLDLQPRLLRVLEAREVQPLGSDAVHRVDVRVVAATHRDLEAMVRDGGFREDLLHRLAVVPIELPPLRDRPGDIPLLVEHLVDTLSLRVRLSAGALEKLGSHPWPGNVRALRNYLERVAALHRGPVVEAGDLDLPAARAATQEERRAELEAALERNGGNKTATARELGIPLATFKRRLKKLGIY